MAKHYTGVVEIFETETYIPKDNLGRSASGQPTGREKTEVARIIVRGSSMAEVTARVNEHIALLSDQYAPVVQNVELKDNPPDNPHVKLPRSYGERA